MGSLKAIGFDLFNTLITVDRETLVQAMEGLIRALRRGGLHVPAGPFKEAYKRHAMAFLEKTKRDGRETHNRLWIAAALMELGNEVDSTDPRIEEAVEQYFSAFFGRWRLLPGTLNALEVLKTRFRLGLLTNFTHAPAARSIIREAGLEGFFQVILISGEMGYRKPHPFVFERLVKELEVETAEVVYIGDDPGPDIYGARDSGIKAIWTLYAEKLGVRHVADLAYQGLPPPDGSVPRISSWEELFDLLEADNWMGNSRR